MVGILTSFKVKAILLNHGATEAPTRPATTSSRVMIDLEEVTHIISANTDFPGYTDAVNLMIPVVTPEWAKHSAAKGRLAHVRPFTPDPRFFFSNVVATVAELPPGDKEAICGGIVAMGGQYSHHLTKFTTHIVALNTDNVSQSATIPSTAPTLTCRHCRINAARPPPRNFR
jgi:hypothetical protein